MVTTSLFRGFDGSFSFSEVIGRASAALDWFGESGVLITSFGLGACDVAVVGRVSSAMAAEAAAASLFRGGML